MFIVFNRIRINIIEIVVYINNIKKCLAKFKSKYMKMKKKYSNSRIGKSF